MAIMSRCCICNHFNISNQHCDVYKDKIPKEIFIEKKPCEHYFEKVFTNDDNLPVAKGR